MMKTGQAIDQHRSAPRSGTAPRRSGTAPVRSGAAPMGSAAANANANAMVGRRLADVERELVLATLARCAGNRTWAADILGLAPLELRDRLIGYGRASEEEARAVKRREAAIEADMRGAGPRPTYVPSPALLA